MKKTISIFTALTTILWLSGVAMLPIVHAVDFADGDLVRETDEFDVYIIKLVGDKQFKRLILNPDVFNMYGHLNWEDIQVVADGTLADYTTSELVRADGDEKVYKLFPDGDVGTKKWVDSLDCFTTMEYDWDSVYIINTFDRDSYTTASTTMCEEAVVEGEMTLSLASDTPTAASIPYNAMSEPYLKINIAGSGTISQIVLKRTGVGEPNDFNNVYLYEGDVRLTSGRSISSSTSKVTFIGLSITAPTTITVVADLTGSTSTAEAGNVNAFSLVSASDVTSAATVGGTFPIEGNGLTITAVQGGQLTITKNGTLANPTVGEKGVKLSQFQITAAYEIINIERLALYNGGTMNSTEITNLELKDTAGTIVATADAFNSDDIGTLVFDTPYEIGKGENEIFKLYGDLAGDKSDTIGLYFEVDADVSGVGQTYGHKAAVTRTTMDQFAASDTNCHNLTLEGGELTIADNNPVAADIGENTNDTVMMEFSFTAASDLEMRKMRVYICWFDNSGGDTVITADDEITDVKLKDKDTGTILMGPHDSVNFTWGDDDAFSQCNATTFTAGGEAYKDWTDTWDISAGETKNLQLTLDVDADSASTGLGTSDKLGMVLYGYSNWTDAIKYTGTNDYVATTDIVPNTNIDGNAMTIQGTSLSVALGSIPIGIVNAVKGETAVTAVSFIFTAGEASDMEVTDLVLTGWVSDGGTTYTQGVTADGLYAKDVITNLTLYESDGTTKITNGGPKGLTDGDDDGEATFDSLSWTVSAGESKKMIVKGDITTTAASGSPDYIAIEIDLAAHVTAIDDEGNSTTGTANVNDETVKVAKNTIGTLTSAAAAVGIKPDQTYVYQGQTKAPFSKYKFTSAYEAFVIDKLTIECDDSTNDAGLMTKVTIEYPIDAAGTLTTTNGYFGSLASVTFSGLDFYVPKDDYAYMNVYADLATYIDVGDKSATNWDLGFEGDGTTTFHAIGVGSSGVVTAATDTITDGIGNDMYLYRDFPSFTLDGPTSTTGPTMATRILEFTVTNHGDYELVFNSASGDLTFDVLGSGGSTDATFTLYKSDGTEVDDATVTAADMDGTKSASANFNFGTLTTLTIPKNGSQSFYVDITGGKTNWDENGDYLQMKLQNEASIVQWVDGADTDQVTYTISTKGIGIPLVGPEFSISGL